MRSDRILKHPLYKYCMEQNAAYEKDRIFCHHDEEHNIAVAKICIELCRQWQLQIEEDLICAAAYLHDTGRYLQYQSGLSHEIESGKIADVILKETGFTEEETKMIQEAILNHRNSSCEKNMRCFKNALYKADKLSRPCYSCAAFDKCNWPDEQKNKVKKGLGDLQC